jgi:8-oxo-dGTP pyrophosphatase MutT (NUDIX family)
MYKIFINETPLILTNTEGVTADMRGDSKALITQYLGRVKFLHNYIDLLEKSKQYSQVVIFSDDLDKLWADFQGIYKHIEAAGGVVYNQKNEVLFIFRRDFWDLPKGKIDKGETPEIAAIREIQEETGLNIVTFRSKKAYNTYHTYIHKEKRVLKKTYWYACETPELELVPQTTEDIEKAVWIDLKSFLMEKPIIYGSILDVLRVVAQ